MIQVRAIIAASLTLGVCLAAGCSSDSDCAAACDKLKQCAPIIFGGDTFQQDCRDTCAAAGSASTSCGDCVDGASCEELVVGKCAVACGDETDDAPTEPASTGSTEPSATTPPPEAPSSCPFSSDSFSCGAVCDSLIALADGCANDPSVPPNLAKALKAVKAAPKATKKTACVAACSGDSTTHAEQWRCFQGAPTGSCAAIAGCTADACPG